MNTPIPEGVKRKISYKWAAENDKYKQQHVIDVGDVSGHQIRIYEIERAWRNSPPTFNGVRVKQEWLCAVSDYIDINGHSWGYSHYVLENGARSLLDSTVPARPSQIQTDQRRACLLAW